MFLFCLIGSSSIDSNEDDQLLHNFRRLFSADSPDLLSAACFRRGPLQERFGSTLHRLAGKSCSIGCGRFDDEEGDKILVVGDP